jgi:hypothetical protein
VDAEPAGPYVVLERERPPWTALARLVYPRPRLVPLVAGLAALVVTVPFALATQTWSSVMGEWVVAALALTLLAWSGIWVGRRLLAGRRRVVADRRDWYEVRTAAAARRTIIASWRQLRQHVDVGADPRPVIDRAMWDLAGGLLERARVRAAQEELKAARAELPPGEPVAAELTARLQDLARASERLDADLARRVVHLSSLAESCLDFLLDQAAITRARQVAREADEVLGAASARLGDDPDTGRDLAERTSAVLDAYRELQRHVAEPLS